MAVSEAGVPQREEEARATRPGGERFVSASVRRWLRSIHPVAVAVAALIAYLALLPLGYLLWGAFFDEGGLTLEFFSDAYSAFGLGSMVANSLLFAAGSTAIAVGLGSALAFLVVRTDVPLKRLIFVASLVPLIVPGILYTIAWILLASPRTGLLNRIVEPLLGEGAFDVFSMAGMILVEGLHLSPLAFLLMVVALRSMDGSLEEAAIASGARLPTVLRRVTLPLARPAILAAVLVMMVRALESFEVPALLGLPGGVSVFTSRIWRSLEQVPPDLGEAGAYSVSLLVATAVGVLLYRRLTRGEGRFQATASGSRPPRIALGRLRGPITALSLLYLLAAAALPVLILVYASTQPFYSPPSAETISRITLDNYVENLSDEGALTAWRNSLLLGVGTATAVMAAMAVAAWTVSRVRGPGGWLVDGLATLPLAIPGLVLGVAVLFLYLRFPVPVYGTLWILFIAYFTRFMPYGLRFCSSAMQQLGRDLEDSARASGAGWWLTFRRVLLPLLLPALAAGWIYILIVSIRELSSSILLYTPGSEVLSVRIFEQYQGGELNLLAALGVLLIVALAILGGLVYRLGGRLGAWEAGAPV
jgi:iron(III) transport system permease protein